MKERLNSFFKLDENGTTISTEVLAGFTTFFTMAYILFVNPDMLSATGLPYNAVYIATIAAAIVGTLVMGLFANVPYAQAPGMGLNAFFTFTVVLKFGYTAYEALALVFICGVINILITVTRVRKHIVGAIPETLQQAIGAGIGLFIAYIGLLNVGIINFGAGVPGLVENLATPSIGLFLTGLVLTVVLMLRKVKGAMLIGIIGTTLLGIPMGIVDVSGVAAAISQGYSQVFADFGSVFGKALSSEGMGSLFATRSIWEIFPIVFAFSLTDTFDTIGTFIGTGRRTGIFSEEDERALVEGKGFSSKMDKAMFADAIASSVGAIFGTSNTTTFVESSAGIEEGGRTGLTSVVVAGLFFLSIFAAPVVGLVPSEATAPALVIVGILMAAAFGDIDWKDLRHAIPAFITIIFTVLSYSISNGLAFGFMAYIVVGMALGNAKKIHPIVYVSTLLFAINFAIPLITKLLG